MLKNKIPAVLAAVCLLAGCTQTAVPSEPEAVPEAEASAAPAVLPEETNEAYHALMKEAALSENYTAGVQRSYDMLYEDGTRSAFDLDGVLEEDSGKIHITQHINADGIQSEVEGWYDGSRLYMNYNTVEYYEDMNADAVRDIMLVKIDPYEVKDTEAASVTAETSGQGTVYTFVLTPEAAADLFENRYDIYGLKQYDAYEVTSGILTQTFDETGAMTGESSAFVCTVVVDGIRVDIDVSTAVGYLNRGSTEVVISDAQKEAFAAYVNYKDIDTDAISDADITSDYPEDTAEATFRKRLVNRLNYVLQDDGTYLAEFNETESYRVDFEHSLFTYSNRTSHYVYNWKGDQGGFGDKCSVDFVSGTHTNECEESAVEQIENVKKYFAMELYYCGLSLEDLRSEAE